MNGPATSRTRRIRRQIIVLLVAAGLLASALVLAIAWRHDTFAATADVHFVTGNATGLAPGTTVRLSGYRVGSVSDIELQRDNKVRVTLSIRDELFDSLRADASAELIREQLRAPALELDPGTSDASLVGENPRIAFRRGASLTEIAGELRTRIGPILDDVKAITGALRESQGDVQAVIANARAASQELTGAAVAVREIAESSRGRIERVGARLESTAAGVDRSVARAGALIGQAEAGLATVNAALPALVGKADRTLDQLQGVAADARTVSRSAAAELPAVLRAAPPLVDDARELVQGVRGSWPLRTMLPDAAPALLPIDSHDARGPGAAGGR